MLFLYGCTQDAKWYSPLKFTVQPNLSHFWWFTGDKLPHIQITIYKSMFLYYSDRHTFQLEYKLQYLFGWRYFTRIARKESKHASALIQQHSWIMSYHNQTNLSLETSRGLHHKWDSKAEFNVKAGQSGMKTYPLLCPEYMNCH